MCGIFCSVKPKHALKPNPHLLKNLKARGPDSIREHVVVLANPQKDDDSHDSTIVTFVSSVLALRGDRIQDQPLIDEQTGSVFCWNGEAWKIGDNVVSDNDSAEVFQMMLFASKTTQPLEAIVKLLTSIAGPFAFVYFDAVSSILFYGRDRLGRRSLMNSRDATCPLLLSSNSTNSSYASCEEIDPATLHMLDLADIVRGPDTLPWHIEGPYLNKSLPSFDKIADVPTANAVDHLQSQLLQALRLRVTDIPSLSHTNPEAAEAKIAVLFSGGLDCTLLARLSHELLPLNEPIDLLNVAFENPRSFKAANLSSGSSPFEICPDRITGRSSHAELIRSCLGRTWQFVSVNVPYSESLQHRPDIIDLMHPHATEMDLSIAMALYFAARGKGLLYPDVSYRTPARVLLSGLGADELFAGYTRHATSFFRKGFQGLVDELELDFDRIGSRNLGRDDRVMCYWGREVRYPYLDEAFVAFALRLPVWEKSGFREGGMQRTKAERSGDRAMQAEDLDPAKMLLRMLAWKLNMPAVAEEKKRAIQFGAKTAKMHILPPGQGRSRGTDVVT